MNTSLKMIRDALMSYQQRNVGSAAKSARRAAGRRARLARRKNRK